MINQDSVAIRIYAKIRALREEADILERTLQECAPGTEASEQPRQSIRPDRKDRIPAAAENGSSKYSPLLKAIQTMNEGLTHPEICALAKKTVREFKSANAVRTWVYSQVAEGTLVEKDAKYFANKFQPPASP